LGFAVSRGAFCSLLAQVGPLEDDGDICLDVERRGFTRVSRALVRQRSKAHAVMRGTLHRIAAMAAERGGKRSRAVDPRSPEETACASCLDTTPICCARLAPQSCQNRWVGFASG
jgi:hypothetical protein